MKKLLCIISIVSLFWGCNKDNNSNSSAGNNYTGSYIGNVNLYINGNFHSTQSKSVSISSTNTNGLFMMPNNIFMSTTCNISGNNLLIPSATTATTSSFKVVEYGTGSFTGNTLTIEFFQDQVSLGNNSVTNVGIWRGTLTRQ